MAVMTGAGMLVGGADLVMKMTPSLSEHPPLVQALTVKLYLFRDIVILTSMVLKLEDGMKTEKKDSTLCFSATFQFFQKRT